MEDLVIKNILESMTDSLIVIGKKGEIIYTNSATASVLGCDIEQLKRLGLGITFFSMEQNVAFNQIFIDAIRDKSLRSYAEVPYIQPNGTRKRLSVTTSYLMKLHDGEQDFLGIIALFKDITETADLREREKALLEARQKASQEQIKALQKLAAGVAHEIRNPIVTIGGFATRIMKNSDMPEPVIRQAHFILENSKKLERVVTEVQRYCDIDIRIQSLVELEKVIEEAIVAVSHEMISKGMKCAIEKDVGVKTECQCDPDLLRAALEQLLENAIYFAPENSTISIKLSRTANELSVSIQDQGTGISPGDMAYIFNPFFSTRADKPGMGLPTVLRIINAHMGFIAVDSENGTGTCITITLPRNLGGN
jgi:PAS domain S-box-containing protein